MTQPIQDWRDAYDAMHSAASIAKDTLSGETLSQIRALISQTEDGVCELMGVLQDLTLTGACILEDRAKLYGQAVRALVDGPKREAQLLLRKNEEHAWIKSIDMLNGGVDVISRAFDIPRHVVMGDVSALYERKFEGD